MMTQAIALAKMPHIIVGTPGRLVDHLQNTKGFSLRTLKYLVLDGEIHLFIYLFIDFYYYYSIFIFNSNNY